MKRLAAATPAIVACTLLAACAGGPPPTRLQRAVDENNRGEQFFARGDYKGAADHFRRALAAAESIEDEDAIAANLVNLSIVQQRLGDRAGAVASAERILNERNLAFADRRIAEAALRRALLAMEAGEHAAAADFAAKAEAKCRESCALRGKLLGLRGYLALAAGDGPQAAKLGREAITLQRAAGDQEELANALRLLGSALLLPGASSATAGSPAGSPAEALAPLNEALTIDKKLALARAVANDLLMLGRAHARLGDAAQARAHFERAMAAAQADGNKVTVEQARQGLAGMPGGAAPR